MNSTRQKIVLSLVMLSSLLGAMNKNETSPQIPDLSQATGMETLTDVDFEVLLASIGSLGLYQKFPTYFANYGPEEKQHCINAHTRIIKAMLDSHSISYPEEMTSDWLEGLKTSLILKQNNYYIDISGLNKIEIAQALFKQARSVEDKFKIPSNLAAIDYIGRRPIKADLSQNTFDTRLYNKENGEEAAQRAIAKLRARELPGSISNSNISGSDDDQVIDQVSENSQDDNQVSE